jgi:hypothetical protein
MGIMQKFWDFLVSHKREAVWAALCALIFGPLTRWISFFYSKIKVGIADFKDSLSTKSRLMHQIWPLQFKQEKLKEYLASTSKVYLDLIHGATFSIGLLAIGKVVDYLWSLDHAPLGPWRLLPAAVYALAALAAFDTARIAVKRSPEYIRYEIAQIDKKLVVLFSHLEEVDPITAKYMLQS